MKHETSATKKASTKAPVSSAKRAVYAKVMVAVANRTRGVDLRAGRVYRVLGDARAKRAGFVRVVDDSGEDYLYPTDYFQYLKISKDQALRLVPER